MAQPLASLSHDRRQHLFEDILQALEQLPVNLKQVFVMNHYEGKSPAEIANEISLDEELIRQRLMIANESFYRSLRSINAVV